MKVRTSITLSKAALRAAERLAGKGGSRSQVIETAILELAARGDRAARDVRDREIIDHHAAALNREAMDVLDNQANHDA